MDPFQVRQALQEVRHLRRNILQKQLFKGYSGRARALGGCTALAAGLLGQVFLAGGEAGWLFILWGAVFVLAILFNYGALAAWFFSQGGRKGDLSYTLEVVPVWIVGGALTLALWSHGMEDLLFGTWMGLFGLAQSIGRSRLPPQVAWVGCFYILAGILCLFFSEGSFHWPVLMGLVFFVGELFAGLVMHTADHEDGLAKYLKLGK